MGHTVTELATWPGALTAPDDGDDLVATSGGADVPAEDVFKNLASRSRFLHDALNGFMLGGETLSSNGGTSLTGPAIAALVLGDYVCGTAGGPINATHLDTGSSFPANSELHVYTYASSVPPHNAAAFQVSLVAPDVARKFKSGVNGSQYRYLGTFFTDASGNVIPFNKVRGQYLYQLSKAGTSCSLQETDAPVIDTTLSLVPIGATNPIIPSVAHQVLMRARVNLASGVGTRTVSIRTDAADANNAVVLTAPGLAGSPTTIEFEFWVTVNASRQLTFICSAGINGVDWFIKGWMEG